MTKFISLADIEMAPAGEPLSVWLPSEHIGCHQVEVPPVGKRKWQAMIPWMLEDRLLARPEDMAFVSREVGDRKVQVVVAANATVEKWRADLDAQSVNYVELVPDFFALPWRKGEVSLAQIGERCLVRYGEYLGAVGPRDLLIPQVETLIGELGAVPVLYGEADPELLPAALHGDLQVCPDVQLFETPPQEYLAVATGDLRRQKPVLPLPAAIAAVLAVVALGLFGLGNWLESRQIREQADYFEGQLRRGYRQYFGEDYDFSMADFQRVVSSRLEGGASTGSIGVPLRALVTALANCGDCSIEQLKYSEGTLTATVSGEGAEALQKHVGLNIQKADARWQITVNGGQL